MALGTGSLIEVSVNMLYNESVSMNVWQYEVQAMLGTPSAAEVGAAWWDVVKATYRALPTVASGNVFRSVIVRDLSDPTGVYGEFSVPSGEQAGTRVLSGEAGQPTPTFVAGGVRLTVGTRLTRPGQKRIPFVYEIDSEGNFLSAAWVALARSLFDVMTNDLTLGSPALGTILQPIVCSKALGAVTDWQSVVGYVINPNITSQVSRKFGRGI
jgi:hypothetical protein